MHQVREQPVVFADPLALRIISSDAASKVRLQARLPDPRSGRYLRAFLVARSRLAEDELAAAVERGVRQYVVLGAGLDTFAYRNPHAGVRVFEVDHPATQEWKRYRLAEAGIVIPSSVTFVPVDFARQTIADGLAGTSFVPHESAFFSWLGVTMYLARADTLATLSFIASMSGEHTVVFDFAVPRGSLGFLHRVAFDALARRVAASGEPFQGFFDPAELERELRAMGYRSVACFDAARLNARYFDGRRDGFRVHGRLARLAVARR